MAAYAPCLRLPGPLLRGAKPGTCNSRPQAFGLITGTLTYVRDSIPPQGRWQLIHAEGPRELTMPSCYALPPSKEAAIPLELVEGLRRGDVLALVGSGLSLPLGFPTWRGLIKKLSKSVRSTAWTHDPNFENWVQTATHLDWVAEVLRADRPEAFKSGLIDCFRGVTPLRFSLAHSLLALLPFRGYWTTNYDTAIEDNLAVFEASEPRVMDFEEASTDLRHVSEHSRIVLKLHGCVRKSYDNLVLTSSDYFKLMHDERYRRLLAALFSRHPILVMGYSLHDKDFRSLLEERHHLYGRRCPPIYALMGRQDTCEAEMSLYRSKYDVQLIPISEEAGFRELTQVLMSLFCLVHHLDSDTKAAELAMLIQARVHASGRMTTDTPVSSLVEESDSVRRLLASFHEPVAIDAFTALCTDQRLRVSTAHVRILAQGTDGRITSARPLLEPNVEDRKAVAAWLAVSLEAIPVGDGPSYLSTHRKKIFSEHCNTLAHLLANSEGWRVLVGDDEAKLTRINEYFRQEGRWQEWLKIAEAAVQFVPSEARVYLPLVRSLLWVYFWTRRLSDVRRWLDCCPSADGDGESSYKTKLRYMNRTELPGVIMELKAIPSRIYWQDSLLGRSYARLSGSCLEERASMLTSAKTHLAAALTGARNSRDLVETSVQHWYLACVCSDLGEHEEAREHLGEVRRLDECIMGRKPGIAWLRVAEYRVELNKKEDKAEDQRVRAIAAMEQLGMLEPEEFVTHDYYY